MTIDFSAGGAFNDVKTNPVSFLEIIPAHERLTERVHVDPPLLSVAQSNPRGRHCYDLKSRDNYSERVASDIKFSPSWENLRNSLCIRCNNADDERERWIGYASAFNARGTHDHANALRIM